MRRLTMLLLTLLSGPVLANCGNLLDYQHRALADESVIDLCNAYAGKVVLVVNTASQCGFTGQFRDLEALYQRYREAGLVVLGFPSADFRQEHRDENKTASVCYLNYGVTFPMFATSSVRGAGANPLFLALAGAQGEPAWNFHKYLIGRDGAVLHSFASAVAPLNSPLEHAVKAALK
ncbi:MAG: glutathione peroxidase [Alcanivoracaceae bacterium]